MFLLLLNRRRESIDQDQQVVEQVDDPQLVMERIQNKDAVQSFIEEVKCPICYDILFDPKCCSGCEKAFCNECLKKWIDQNQEQPLCPCCRIKQKQKVPPKLLIALLNKLSIACKNQNLGCSSIIGYEVLKKHETQECLYTIINCDNIECKEKIQRKDLQKHKSVCLYEYIKCLKCEEKVQRYKNDLHLIQECPCRECICKWCHSTMQYIDLLNHEPDCPCGYEKCKNCNTKYKIDKFLKHTKLDCMKKQKKYFKKKFQAEKEKCSNLNVQLEQQNELINNLQRLLQGQHILNSNYDEEYENQFAQQQYEQLDPTPYQYNVEECSDEHSVEEDSDLMGGQYNVYYDW